MPRCVNLFFVASVCLAKEAVGCDYTNVGEQKPKKPSSYEGDAVSMKVLGDLCEDVY